MARTTVTGNLFTYEYKHTDTRKLLCPFGCEYSANPADYWMGGTKPFSCEHDGVQHPCALVERANISGTDAQGRGFYGTVWVTLKESATIEDLRA